MAGWRSGSSRKASLVIEPQPGKAIKALAARGLQLNPKAGPKARPTPPRSSIAVKPQTAPEAVPPLGALCRQVDTWSSRSWPAARLAFLQKALPPGTAIVRAMPNTPAAIGRGITVAVANAKVSARQRDLATDLLAAVGAVEWVDDEALMDAVTAVSGSGPAYVFLLAEAMAAGRRCRRAAGSACRHGWRVRPSPVPANYCIARRSMPPCCGRTSPRRAAPPPRRWKC